MSAFLADRSLADRSLAQPTLAELYRFLAVAIGANDQHYWTGVASVVREEGRLTLVSEEIPFTRGETLSRMEVYDHEGDLVVEREFDRPYHVISGDSFQISHCWNGG